MGKTFLTSIILIIIAGCINTALEPEQGGSLALDLIFPASLKDQLDKGLSSDQKIEVIVTSDVYNKIAEIELSDKGDHFEGTLIIPKGDRYVVAANYIVDSTLIYFGVQRNVKVDDGQSTTLEIELHDPDEMAFISAGYFFMGDENGRDNCKPVHQVHITSFYMDKYEVTNAQFVRFLNQAYSEGLIEHYLGDITCDGVNLVARDYWFGYFPHHFCFEKGRFIIDKGKESYPAAYVTWYGAKMYAEFYGKSLPTEAQWEYAARGGELSNNYFYSGSDNWMDVAWFNINGAQGVIATRPVGHLEPNELGIYDMNGNVSEWCNDWYDADYYKQLILNDPQGPKEGTAKVVRGGAWSTSINPETQVSLLASRGGGAPKAGGTGLGFRCVKND